MTISDESNSELDLTIWNPYEVFKIDIDLAVEGGCHWYISPKIRCKNKIRKENLNERHLELGFMKECQPSSKHVSTRLTKVAELMLCQGNHRRYAYTLKRELRKNLDDYCLKTQFEDSTQATQQSTHRLELESGQYPFPTAPPVTPQTNSSSVQNEQRTTLGISVNLPTPPESPEDFCPGTASSDSTFDSASPDENLSRGLIDLHLSRPEESLGGLDRASTPPEPLSSPVVISATIGESFVITGASVEDDVFTENGPETQSLHNENATTMIPSPTSPVRPPTTFDQILAPSSTASSPIRASASSGHAINEQTSQGLSVADDILELTTDDIDEANETENRTISRKRRTKLSVGLPGKTLLSVSFDISLHRQERDDTKGGIRDAIKPTVQIAKDAVKHFTRSRAREKREEVCQEQNIECQSES